MASGLAKFDFNSESADCRSASPNELIICSGPGVADGDDEGVGDFCADDGVGVCANKIVADRNERAVAAARFNIVFIVSRSQR